MNSNTSVALVRIDRCFADGEGLALAGSTSSALGGTSRPEVGLEQPSLVGCARLRASTIMRRRKVSSLTHPRSICAVPGWTTSRTRQAARSGIAFEDRGQRTLEGVPGTWAERARRTTSVAPKPEAQIGTSGADGGDVSYMEAVLDRLAVVR